jgi:phosphopantetheinyl transferase (holo-ACP synthase)
LSYQIKQILTNNDITIKVLHYSKEGVNDLDLAMFTTVELEKFNSYGSEKRKLEFYFSRVLWLTFGHNEILKYKSTGKPILDNGFLSMSHSHEHIVIAYSKHIELGIDIEMISEKINKVKSKFLHSKDQYNSLKDLTQLWTIKEAFYKLFDGENSFLMDDVFIDSVNETSHAELKRDNLNLHGKAHSFFIEKDFIITYIIPSHN